MKRGCRAHSGSIPWTGLNCQRQHHGFSEESRLLIDVVLLWVIWSTPVSETGLHSAVTFCNTRLAEIGNGISTLSEKLELENGETRQVGL